MLTPHQAPEAVTSITKAAQRMFSEVSSDFAITLSSTGAIEYANDGAQQLLAGGASGLRGQQVYGFMDASCADQLRAELAVAYAQPGSARLIDLVFKPQPSALVLTHQAEALVHVASRIFFDSVAKCLWVVGQDTSQFKLQEAELLQRATHDVLTGLPNRALLTELIELRLVEAREAGTLVAAVMLDLDGFKKANDAYGHLAGDILLKEAATRIKKCIREEDTVSRTGGDEFLLVLPDLQSIEGAEAICHRILEAIQRPTLVQGQEVYVTASLGIALYPLHGETVAELTHHADQAMYQSKKSGKNRFTVYTPGTAPKPTHPVKMEAAMHAAIQNGEFQVHFQPLVNLQGELVGTESLLRWQLGDGTWVPPDVFIPIAERNGLINVLGDYALRATALHMRQFNAVGLSHLVMGVNVSPRQLRNPDFEKNLRKVLAMTEVDPARLVIEITESQLMQEPERTKALLNKIVDTGVKLTIDDFGTGYSCLSYLRTYPISGVKLDKTFIDDIEVSDTARSVVQAILKLAQALKLHTVVEGVETQGQADLLASMGADSLQGYLFSRPLPPTEFIKRFAR